MSWEECRQGVVQVLRDVDGLRSIDDAVPPAVNAWPYAYVLYRGGEHALKGGIASDVYIATVRVLFPWQDPRAAEGTLAPIVNRLPAAFDRQRDLYGRIKNGSCLIQAGPGGLEMFMAKVAGVEYLALDVRLRIVENSPQQER